MISTSSLSLSYEPGAATALSDVSFSIARGSVCTVLGPTGCGKTTLLHALSGLFGAHGGGLHASGSVTIDSEIFNPLPQQTLFPRVMMLLQEPHLQLSGMAETVEDEVQWTLTNLGVAGEECLRRALATLDALHILNLRKRLIRTLSGGELHRVALASVLVVEPLFLMLDEPASSLDQNARQTLLQIIASIKDRTTVLFTDTDADLAFRIADQIVLLDEGSVVFNGSRSAFRERLSEFGHLLPLEDWIHASEQLAQRSSSRISHRISSLIEGI